MTAQEEVDMLSALLAQGHKQLSEIEWNRAYLNEWPAEKVADEPERKMQTIKPRADCPDCHGSGEVNDWVPAPFGSGNVPMPSLCWYVDEQTDEDTDEVLLDLSEVQL